MGFSRALAPTAFAVGKRLTEDMISIGMRFAGNEPKHQANIEDTLIAASLEGIAGYDYRVLSLLVDWFDLHHKRVNADRLIQLVIGLESQKVKSFWSALAQWKSVDHRFSRLAKIQKKDFVISLTDDDGYLIGKHGEDFRFVNTSLRVHRKLLRHRPADIQTPAELAKYHRAYYFRTLVGASYRSDMLAMLEQDSSLTPSRLATLCYGSIGTAWEVIRDWRIVNTGKKAKIAS